MSEADTINTAESTPHTVDSLADDLQKLGVRAGMTVITHTSLSRLGWVCGGAQAVILALQQVLGETGTLVMPAQSTGNSEPSYWENPPVPESWWPAIRENMPAFDKHLTPTRIMGAVAELFRCQPGTLRSNHPQLSFTARGPQAVFITSEHALDDGFGDDSPLAKIYDLQGHVLLLGVGHGNNTSLHLGENRADFPSKAWLENGSAIFVDGQRQWQTFSQLDEETDDFEQLGADFARDTGLQTEGPVGAGAALFMPQVALVDYTVAWMEKHRQ